MMLLLLSGYVEKVYKLHLHVPQPSILLFPNRNFVNGHLLTSSCLDQTWAALFQNLEVGHATEVLSSGVIWLSKSLVDLVGLWSGYRRSSNKNKRVLLVAAWSTVYILYFDFKYDMQVPI